MGGESRTGLRQAILERVEGEYVTHGAHPALRGLVHGYTGYREFSRGPVRRRQAPVGSCALILGFGFPLRLDGPAGPLVPSAFLAGMHDAVVVTEFTGDQHGLQVDLSPPGVLALLRRPTSELTNRTPQLDELGDRELAALPERLAADPDWPHRFARLDAFLCRRLLGERSPRADPEVGHAWRTLVRHRGAVPVEVLAADVGWSRRHLLTRFTAQIGLAPKPAARVLRFSHAGRLLRAGLPAADVASTAGYSDQSHLSREFRSLAGCTPATYVREWAPVESVEFSSVQDGRRGRP